MLHIPLIPFFEQLDEFFPPTNVCFLGQLHIEHIWIEVVEDVYNSLLAIIQLYLGVISDFVGPSINSVFFDVLEEHSSEVLLVVGLSLPARNFHDRH